MSSWGEVRRIANLRHDELAPSKDALCSAAALLSTAQDKTEIKVITRPRGDTLLDGSEAAYDRERSRIYVCRETPEPLAHFHVAHEFAHHWLDSIGASCASVDLDPFAPAEPELSPIGSQDSYSPKERAEAQANLFAREFLLPREKLRRRCANGIPDADAIAAEVGVPVDLVMQQLSDALLLPPESDVEPEVRKEAPPDKSQLEAIMAPDEPWLVRAGPGTGKTRTLVGRVAHLIERGEDPASILALSYSVLSAQDLNVRIHAAIGERATQVWSGTFHAYGLELLRKYGNLIGFNGEPKLRDRTDSLMLLEEVLPELELNHYLDLHEPMLKLRSILNAISRAKDELASPEDYRRYAQAMKDSATDSKTHEVADKALEVAKVYTVYEKTLRERGWVDFGDLVALPIKLLREHPDVRDAVRSEKRHILVDEYQDMNRASGILLKELTTPGKGPWVVGDVRQAIYRFRGASPLNMARFADDFPGAKTTDLSVNYRSGGKIVRLFETFGATMSGTASAQTPRLAAHRGEDRGTINFDIATNRESENHGIAQTILQRVGAGTKFSDHAVIGRTHRILAKLAAQLERAGVPCLYFGDFFERPEVRDLLSLLSLVSEPRGIGLLRIAQAPCYGIPPKDLAILFALRRERSVTMLSLLRDLESVTGLSEAGRRGLERLAQDVQDSDWPVLPHTFLMSFLLRRSGYLTPLLLDAGVAGQQRRLAIYQLLQFAFAFKPPKGHDPKRAFLKHIRRLEILDEEKQLRQLPAAVNDIDAVRLMTIHSAKGLEFPIVHILCLTRTLFPASGGGEHCPLPVGLASTDPLMTKAAEEDSLFFVGASRAKDGLHLSHAKKNGRRNENASRLLDAVSSHLPRPLTSAATWVDDGSPAPVWSPLVGRSPGGEWSAREIETYLECPRRFYYEFVLELGGSDSDSPFLKFQSALHSSIAWLRNTPSAEERRAGLAARFEEDWQKFGPGNDPFEPLYRRMADAIIQNALGAMDGDGLKAERQVVLKSDGTVISCRADHVERTSEGIVIRRLKAGRLAKNETDKARYALIHAAMQDDHPEETVLFEHVSLLNGERRRATKDANEVAEDLREFEAQIKLAGDGEFPPRPHERCPTCPYFFICPSEGLAR